MEAHRMTELANLWTSLTERERAIFKDAAVAGYVKGKMYSANDVPKDDIIVAEALYTINSNRDLYRAVSGYTEEDDDD